MNLYLINLEIAVALLGLGILLMDLWLPPDKRRQLGYLAAIGVALILAASFVWPPLQLKLPAGPLLFQRIEFAFGGSYVVDLLALFFKRFFLLAAVLVLLMAVEFSDRFAAGVSEYFSLVLFALVGMMLAASANDFVMLFVSIELITVTFYVLTSFQRSRLVSLEAGVKYLILGAMASAFMVYGIALVYGVSGTFNFYELAAKATELSAKPVFLMGLLLVLLGLGFKIAAFPLQIWTPDVYQGAPTPTTAFLAIGSKAAGFVLLLRFLFIAVPAVTQHWTKLLVAISALTILYGNLCAIPQRNLKRLLGYSSIAHAGYLLLGVVVLAANRSNPLSGGAAMLYYLAGYLFTVLAAFAVIVLVMRTAETEDISGLAGLSTRSPLLAATLTFSMMSLAGVPPLAGFFGKFLLLKAVLEQGAAYYGLVAVALIGMVISLYYYFGVIRAVYWSPTPADLSPVSTPVPMRLTLAVCIVGMFFLGIFPGPAVRWASEAISVLAVKVAG